MLAWCAGLRVRCDIVWFRIAETFPGFFVLVLSWSIIVLVLVFPVSCSFPCHNNNNFWFWFENVLMTKEKLRIAVSFELRHLHSMVHSFPCFGIYWSPGRWGWTRVGIPQQAFFQGWLLPVLLTSGALSDPVLFKTVVRHWLLTIDHDCIAVGCH